MDNSYMKYLVDEYHFILYDRLDTAPTEDVSTASDDGTLQ
jgi:hypothetical protein